MTLFYRINFLIVPLFFSYYMSAMEVDVIEKEHTAKLGKAITLLRTFEGHTYQENPNNQIITLPIKNNEDIHKKLGTCFWRYDIHSLTGNLNIELLTGISNHANHKVTWLEASGHSTEKDTLYIDEVNTDEDYRRKGYATFIMNQCMELAKQVGYTKVFLKSRPYCCSLYEKLGFEYAPYKKTTFLPPHYGGPVPVAQPMVHQLIPMYKIL